MSEQSFTACMPRSWQQAHLDYTEDARVFLNGVTCTVSVLLVLQTTTHLMAFYLGQLEWSSTSRNIHSLTPCLSGYYTTSLINVLTLSMVHGIFLAHLSGLTIFFYDSLQVFFGLHVCLLPLQNPCIFFTQLFSSVLKTRPYHPNPVLLYHCNYITCS